LHPHPVSHHTSLEVVTLAHQDRTWTARYLTWEKVEVTRDVVRRPADGWISWLMSNFWRASLPAMLCMVVGLVLLFLMPSLDLTASLVVRPGLLEEVLNVALLVVGASTFIYWLSLLHHYPFEDSPHPEKDRALWLLLQPLIHRRSHEPTLPPATDAYRRWLQVPVEISWHQHNGAPRLSWAARYVDARPVEGDLSHLPQGQERTPPRLGNGSVELRPRGFALELLRDPRDSGWTLELRSTRRGARLALELPPELVQPDALVKPVAEIERARVHMQPGDARELSGRLALLADLCDAPRPRALAAQSEPQPAQVQEV
jgi:hypothetical protein